MQMKSVLFGAAVTAAAFLTAGRVFSGDDAPPAGPTPEQQKLTQPGPEHASLAAYEGSWEGKGVWGDTAWTSRMTAKMVMGGRFLQMEEEIAMAGAEPHALHMMTFVGYDNLQKQFVSMGLGDEGTQFSRSEGYHDATKHVSEMHGVEHGPGGKDVNYRYTIGDVVDGTFHLDVFFQGGTGEQKALTADYKKK